MTVGFVGIGNMGLPMVRRIASHGHALQIYDLDSRKAELAAAECGARACADLASVAADVDVIITMLPTSDHVERVFEQLAPALRPGCILLEMSSGDPTVTRRLAETAASTGVHVVDAPVSGGVARALTGDLAIMLGGDAATAERVEPLLRTMGSTILRTGGVGSAHAMKALNNLSSAAGMLTIIEIVLIGQRFGLDPAVMVDVLNVSSGVNNASMRKMKQFILNRAFDSGFPIGLLLKDIGIAIDLAHDVGVDARFGEACQALWKHASSELGPDLDHTAVAKFLERA